MEVNLVSLIAYISAALELIIGVVVFLNDRKNKVNRLFALFTFVTAYWIMTNSLMNLEPRDFWIKNIYAAGVLVSPVSLVWFSYFIKKRVNWGQLLAALIPAGVIFVLTYCTDLVVKSIEFTPKGGLVWEFGPVFTIYSLYSVAIILWTVFLITRAFIKSKGPEKLQYKFIAFGVYGFAFTAATVSFVLPLFGIDSLINLDSPSSIIFVAAISFVILKHHLFNIKVIATELITFALWIFVLIRTLVADNVQDMVVNGGLLVILVIFGVLLIKSVIQETKIREKVEKLASQLKTANDKLQQVDKVKTEFISIASHQLRTPLTIIKGYTSMALEGSLGRFTKQQHEVMDKLSKSAERLINLVEDLLNISRLEQGRIEYEYKVMDIVPLVKSVVEELQPKAAKKGLQLIFKKPTGSIPHVRVDEQKIRQVFFNVIDNAVKYTEKGNVTARVKREVDKVIFTSTDTGIGISKDDLSTLFQKFQRGSHVTQMYTEGVGLGLYFARKVAESHGGKLFAESAGEGKGSVFVVELPMAS